MNLDLKQLVRVHAEILLVGAGILLAAAVGWFLVWGVAVLAEHLGASLAPPRSGGLEVRFDIEGASRIDFRGLR